MQQPSSAFGNISQFAPISAEKVAGSWEVRIICSQFYALINRVHLRLGSLKWNSQHIPPSPLMGASRWRQPRLLQPIIPSAGSARGAAS